MNTGRSKGLCAYLGIQGYSQLKKTYGEEAANSISNSCATKLYLRTEGIEDAHRLSRDIGQIEISEARANVSWGKNDHRDGGGFGVSNTTKPLILPSQIQQLKSGKKLCEGYIKLPNYQWSHIKLEPNIVSSKKEEPFFILREDIKLKQDKKVFYLPYDKKEIDIKQKSLKNNHKINLTWSADSE